MTRVEPTLFNGRIRFVHNPDLLDVMLDLDFGVQLSKRVQVEGFRLDPEIRGTEQARDAKHCALILLRQRRVFLLPDASKRDRWGHLTPIAARVFVDITPSEEVVGVTRNLVDHPVLDLGPFFTHMQTRGWPITEVRKVLKRESR